MVVTKLKFGNLSAIVIGGVAILLVIQHRSDATLREKGSALLQQADPSSCFEALFAVVSVPSFSSRNLLSPSCRLASASLRLT